MDVAPTNPPNVTDIGVSLPLFRVGEFDRTVSGFLLALLASRSKQTNLIQFDEHSSTHSNELSDIMGNRVRMRSRSRTVDG